MKNRKIEISERTIIFIFGLIALIWALYLIRDVIVLLFMAIILMSALSPIVEKLEKFKIPKPLAIALVYLVLVSIIAGLISIGVAPLVEQTNNLAENLPRTLGRILPPNFIDINVIEQQVGSFTGNVLSATFTILGQIIAFISIGVLTFYLLLEHSRFDQTIALFSFGNDKQVKRIVRRIEEKLGAWLRGQIILSLLIGVLSFIALTLLGVPYALPLAIIAGLMEVVPVIGPIISAIPAVLIAYLVSPVLALFTTGAFFVIQQLENHVVVPQVMKKAVGLNPLIVILAVSIGGKLLGFAGALLAVPIAVVIQVVLEEILEEEKEEESGH